MSLPVFFIVVIAAEVARELCFKLGAMRSARPAAEQGNLAYSFKILGNSFIWLGFLLWGVEIMVWVHILQICPLTIALPILSLCYVLLPICSRFLFKEPIPKRKWLAIACITAGVALIGLSGVGG